MARIIMCGSFKGGVGKTASSWNLAYSLAEMGKRVLAVDFDSQANLTTCFGVEDPAAVPVTIGHLMMNRLEDEEMPDPSEFIQSRNGVDFISSSMMLSAVDSKLRMEMGSEKMLTGILEPLRGLYEGDRLEDMAQSIREHGVLNPVIVRKAARGYEMLAGHNRTNAAKIAGLTEVPAIVKTDLSDEDAYVYVIETNLLQRSFAELLPSEKAAVLVARYEKISSQGKRNDIRQEIEALEETCGHDVHKSRKRTCGHDVHKSQKSRDGLGEEYGMTGRNIARYMRLDRLILEFKDAVDKGTLAMVAAVDLSYLNVKMQKLIQQVAEAEGKKLKPKQAVELRKMGKEITKEAVESVLAGKEQKKPQSVSVKLPVELYERYFGQMDAGAVQEIMEKALEGYFGKEAGVSTRLPGTLCTPSASQ